MIQDIKGVKKIMRGLYKVAERGDGSKLKANEELTDWNFHNCILLCQLKIFPPTYIKTTNSCSLINLEFTISKTGNATMRISADNPLNVSSIAVVYEYFSELIKHYSTDDISQKDVYLSSIEFNKDYLNVRLDGVKCITIDNLIEQFKVYQKQSGLRIEHKTKAKFTVENIIDMLQNNPNSLEINMKLSEQHSDSTL